MAILDASTPVPAGQCLLGLKIPDSCMEYRVWSDLTTVSAGDQLLVQVRDGETIATVQRRFQLPVEPFPGPITKIMRRLNDKDLRFLSWRAEQEPRAQRICRDRIRELQLPMKLSRVVYPFGGGKAIIYYTSEERIDFRDLVRLLTADLRVRVEMRHVGVRDESKLLCGLGPCGKTLCCSQFLTRFHPVSVRMAKNQDLSLTPEGISGVCGRLMCCLAYENDAYLELRKGLPKVKSKVVLKDGREGVVRSLYPLLNRVEILFGEGVTEQMDVEKLVGDFTAAAVVEAGGEEEEENGKKADGVPTRPVKKPMAPERSRGATSGRTPQKTEPPTSRKNRPPVPSVSNVAPQQVAVVPLPEASVAEEMGDPGGQSGQPEEQAAATSAKRPPRRRRRGQRSASGGGGDAASMEVTPAMDLAGAEPVAAPTPLVPMASDTEDAHGTGQEQPVRPAGSGRRRRRRSAVRRGGGGETPSAATEGGQK
ncbi:MAG: hypothetical protein G8237_10345 [Magnetococcales bacterium]|nr:hypothetical protein [Magnetococcales bacterium]NGZ06745.1 hypothetical protein [Magnetococcales bacterium]